MAFDVVHAADLDWQEREAPPGTEPLLEPVMRAGRRLAPSVPIHDMRARFERDLASLPDAARRLKDATPPTVALSDAAQSLARTVESDLARRRETV